MIESAINGRASPPLNGTCAATTTTPVLRRSPSAASLRSQTIARLIDCDGLVRRAHEHDRLLALRNNYEVVLYCH